MAEISRGGGVADYNGDFQYLWFFAALQNRSIIFCLIKAERDIQRCNIFKP